MLQTGEVMSNHTGLVFLRHSEDGNEDDRGQWTIDFLMNLAPAHPGCDLNNHHKMICEFV